MERPSLRRWAITTAVLMVLVLWVLSAAKRSVAMATAHRHTHQLARLDHRRLHQHHEYGSDDQTGRGHDLREPHSDSGRVAKQTAVRDAPGEERGRPRASGTKEADGMSEYPTGRPLITPKLALAHAQRHAKGAFKTRPARRTIQGAGTTPPQQQQQQHGQQRPKVSENAIWFLLASAGVFLSGVVWNAYVLVGMEKERALLAQAEAALKSGQDDVELGSRRVPRAVVDQYFGGDWRGSVAAAADGGRRFKGHGRTMGRVRAESEDDGRV